METSTETTVKEHHHVHRHRQFQIDNVQALCLHSLRSVTAPLPGEHLSNEPTKRDQLPLSDIHAISVSGWAAIPPAVRHEHRDVTEPKVPRRHQRCFGITIEPAVFLYYMAFQASQPVMLQYIYARILENIMAEQGDQHQTLSVGPNMTSKCGGESGADFDQQQKAQALSSMYIIVATIFTIVPALFSIILLGAHSDHAGRKWGLLPPTVAECLQTLLCIAVVAFELPLPLILVGQLFEGICGNASLYLMTSFAYVVDIASPSDRAMRIVVVDLISGLAYTVAQIGVGLLIKDMGFLYSYYIILCIYLINLFYLIFILPETIEKQKSEKLFNTGRFKETLELYRQDGSLQKKIVAVGLIILALYMVADQASGGPLTLYFLNYPLCWTSEYIGYYKALEYIIRYVACLLLVCLLVRRAGEGGLLFLGCFSCLLYNIVLAQARDTTTAFLSTIAGFGMELVAAMARTLCSRNVGAHDQGALFSSQGWIALMAGLVGSVSFSALYSATLYLVHGFIFYIATAVFTLVTLLSAYMWRLSVVDRTEPVVVDVSSIDSDSISPKDDAKMAGYTYDKRPSRDPVLTMLEQDIPTDLDRY